MSRKYWGMWKHIPLIPPHLTSPFIVVHGNNCWIYIKTSHYRPSPQFTLGFVLGIVFQYLSSLFLSYSLPWSHHRPHYYPVLSLIIELKLHYPILIIILHWFVLNLALLLHGIFSFIEISHSLSPLFSFPSISRYKHWWLLILFLLLEF